jgi:hypothetical protein
MNADKEKAMQKATNALEKVLIGEAIVTKFCFSILKVFGFSLSVFIRVHPWFQRFSPCA